MSGASPRILYLGSDSPGATSRARAQALVRIGCKVHAIDPEAELHRHLAGGLRGRLHYQTGYRLLQPAVERWVASLRLDTSAFDLAWVNSGELFGPRAVDGLRRFADRIILYNNDDPTGGRDGPRFATLLRAIGHYDLCAVPRDVSVAEIAERGAKRVVRTWLSYDEVANAPVDRLEDVPERFRSDVAFIGTWMRHERRDEFLLALDDRGLRVAIWGDRWQRSPHWKRLAGLWRGRAIFGRDYAHAVRGARVCLGMLSKGNRDLYTRRSVEVPFMGGLLCAERTMVHTEMFRHGAEAMLWSDIAECAEQCKWLLSDAVAAERIRLAGMRRVRELGVGNEDVCRRILASLEPWQGTAR